jgi:gluconokinase
VRVLPFWGGERSPGWSDDATGAIFGLRLHTSSVDILRAALEGIAFRFRALADQLQVSAPGVAEVVATGGALLHNPTWLQIMADVLDRPVLRSAVPEASSRGAALMALEALGLLESPLESLPPPVAARYEPIPSNVAIYRELATRHQLLYEASLR